LSESVVRYLAEKASFWRRDQFLVTAFLVFMARISSSYEFDVGFRHPALRRELASWGMEALFASHVPLHVTLRDQASLAEAFAEVHERIATTIKHKTYARDMVTRFPTLCELYSGEQSPRFPVVVEWGENLHDIEQYKAPLGSELALVTVPDEALEAGHPCAWLYSELFDAENVKSMAGHFQALLEGMVSESSTPICQLPLMAEADRHRLLVEWNDTQADFPRDQCFHELFELQVKRSPEAIAAVLSGRELTYRALNERANQLAHYLQALGVGPEVLVGICMEPSLELVVGIMGILKAGGAYLPLDPASPEERLAFMLEDAQATVVLSQKELAGRLLVSGTKVVCLDTDWPDIAQKSHENPHSNANAENLAYVLYTSGSTGKPKGVMIQHHSIANLATALHKAIYASRLGAPLRLSLNAPIFFDASVQRLAMLLYGHTFYIIPEEVRRDGEALLAFVRRNRLDGIDCVPAQLRLLLAAGLLDESEWTPSMVLLGGEAIDETTWQMLSTATGTTQFFNMYGPTECTVDSTIALVEMNADEPTMGGPVANARAYVLDECLQPVPMGVPGELHIGGAGVARGYLRRPKLTAGRFIPDPFSDEVGARLHKTGDLVRFLPDGTIEFLGRIDYQVKVRGFRIELGEIEAVLSQHLGIREAIVLAAEDPSGDRRLVAYVIPQQKPVPTDSLLRDYLKKTLPEYMVPSAFMVMDAFPLTPSGKVNRRALPAPAWARPALEQAFLGPRTAVEEVLAGIWTEVLGIDRVGVHDNFFELGGDSLLAVQVISRLRARFQIHLPVRTLFERPTVAGLAEAIEQALEMGRPVVRPRILPASRRAQRAAGLSADSPGVPSSGDREP
jgi:amino acid adenylation domain-containing protein